MAGRYTGKLIRILIGAALCMALVASVVAPIPDDLPAIAVRQPGLYRLEVALLVFYGGLLLITPGFSGLIHGRLPIEISIRGAKFAEETDRSVDKSRAAAKELKQTVEELGERLEIASFEIDQLKNAGRDARQPEVDSRQ